jgi:hypothetical protein
LLLLLSLLPCRIVTNLQRTLSEHCRPSKELLLQPLPLDLSHATYGREVKRTMSCASGSTSSSAAEQAPSSLPALPTGGVPAGPGAPVLPAGFPATPTGAARNMQHAAHQGFAADRESARTATSCGTVGASRLSAISASGSSDYSSSSNGALSVQRSSGSGSGSSLGSLRDIQAAIGDYKRPEAAAGLSVSLPSSPKTSFTGGAGGGHLSHLNPAAAAAGSPGSRPLSPSGAHSSSSSSAGGLASPAKARLSAAGSPLKPVLGLGLKVTLPPETDFELCGSSDSFCFSPNTPGPKPGIKERMKFYFQRQAGAAGGF